MNNLERSIKIALTDCLGVKPQETVLIITDDQMIETAGLFYKQAQGYAREAVLACMPPRQNNGQEPPPAIAQMMLSSDVIFMLTSKSLSHTQARRRASAKGARIASMPGATRDMIVRTLCADHQAIKRVGEKLSRIVSRASQVRITAKAGTDLSFSIKDRLALPDHGIIHFKGGFTNLPAGEVYIAPVEGSANGLLVIDGSIADLWPIKKPIKIAIVNGFAEGAEKGRQAEELWDTISAHGRNGLNVAEFGIGINPKAKITGNVLEDEKVLGTIHIAFGDNSGFGGKIKVPSHQDGIVKNPDVWLDGKQLMKNGRLLI
ncbi:aminopeptidase [candidate division TA06 bacterium]|nr:aminopeptidase [candidate division TA06 bacterium]